MFSLWTCTSEKFLHTFDPKQQTAVTCNYMMLTSLTVGARGNVFVVLIQLQVSSAQSLSHVQLFAIPGIAAHQASLSITNSRSSLRLTSIESVMPSSHLILCRRLLLLPPIPPSIRVFSNEYTWTVNFLMFKLVLEKAEEPEIKLPTFAGSSKKEESSRKTSISALLTMLKPLTVWITINCGKF